MQIYGTKRQLIKTTAPLVKKIFSPVHETPDDAVVRVCEERTKLNEIKNSLTLKSKRAVEFASEKGASNWLTVIPMKEMGFTLNKD